MHPAAHDVSAIAIRVPDGVKMGISRADSPPPVPIVVVAVSSSIDKVNFQHLPRAAGMNHGHVFHWRRLVSSGSPARKVPAA